MAIYTAKAAGDYGAISITKNVKQMTGYEPWEFTQSSSFWIDHVHPGDRQRILAELPRLFERRRHMYEYRFLHKDGSYRWMRDEMTLIEDGPGDSAEIVGYFIDITKSKQAEEALRESEIRYRQLFDRVPIGLYRSTPAGQISAANPAMVRMLGYPDHDSLLNMNVRSLYVDAGDRRRLLDEIDQRGVVLDLEYQLRRYDGAHIWVKENVRAIRDAKGVTRYYEGSLENITEQKLAEEELRKERDFSTSLLQASPTFFVAIDADGKTLMMNEAMLKTLGYTEEEVVGTNYLGTFVPEADQKLLTTVFNTLVHSREATLNENRVLTRDGRELLVEWHGRPTFKEGGDFDFFFGVGIDITERRRAEEERARVEAHLRHAHKMQAVGQLAAGVAHDFNSILTIILGNAEHILGRLRDDQLESGEAAALRQITGAVERGAAVVRRLLTFGRASEGKPQVLDLNRIVAEMERMLQPSLGDQIEFRVILASGISPVRADPGQIEEVIMNLVLNARDAMPDGGTLTIETGRVTFNEAHVEARAGVHTMLAVSDTGVGLEEETLTRLFEPFYTTKPVDQGTGLGLSIVHGIVAQAGGHIEVTSKPAKGTTFRVYFPAAEEDDGRATSIRA
jgi:PAS domain S-box-containing protein